MGWPGAAGGSVWASARCCVLISFRPLRLSGAAEYAGSLLLTIAGLMLVFDAGELVLLFVALELISIPTYVLLYLGRRDAPVPGIGRQILLPERALVGTRALRIQFPLRSRRFDPLGRRASRCWPMPRACRRGFGAFSKRGHGADVRRAVLQNYRRAVPFLRP